QFHQRLDLACLGDFLDLSAERCERAIRHPYVPTGPELHFQRGLARLGLFLAVDSSRPRIIELHVTFRQEYALDGLERDRDRPAGIGAENALDALAFAQGEPVCPRPWLGDE